MTLLLALRVAEVGPQLFRPVAALAALLVVAAVIDAVTTTGSGVTTRVADLLLVMITPPSVVVGIRRTLRARNRVTIEAVFGVLCLYLLVGMFFAFLYASIGRISGHFFAEAGSATTPNYLYFSMTTLTTTGYGDLTAASNLGRTLSVSEALIGQIYLVTVVAVIVGNLGWGGRTQEQD